MRTAMAAPLSRDIFAAIYQNYSRFVAGIVAGFSLAPQQQEDVCQDVFLIVWQRQEQLQHEHAFSSWLATITRHRCLQELRRQRSMLALEDLSDATIFLEREPATVPRDQGEGWHLEM